MSPPVERLDADAIRAALSNRVVGNRVIALDQATSTNDFVAQLAPEHVEGLVVFAEEQTAGRGQYGRRWESTAGKGLWFSVLLRPRIGVADSGRLTEFLARSIADTATAELGLAASIKPPNDVYIHDRKVAGVLVEMRVEPSGNYYAIAGMGINVNHSPDDFPIELRERAGSLALAAGRAVDRTAFVIALLRALDERYTAL